MRISIITATYNSEKTLSDTLLSLENQTYTDIEFIIVDGNSKDNTVQLIKDNCTKVSKIICEADQGIYDALNKGINAATGDVIGFLHSDDLLAYNDALADIVNTFETAGCDAVYGDLEYVSQEDTGKRIRMWKSGPFSRTKMRLGWMPPHPSFYMKRSCYIEHGGFSLDYRISADYDSLLRYILKSGIAMAYLPKVLVKMRVGGISNRSLSSMVSKSMEDVRVMKKNGIIWPLALAYKNLSKIPQFIKK
ncbi:glycosyltransferase family 2 protein [Citrobacter portucalensis]|uniref:glycosyltransferase family 2 protein n=1 Tax=Citrobacter portucalensis TaxID=1639133 RepID=UPI002B23B651|nr:glycosyltransferase family 2 protein [Citrobacter portucalensis]MEB0323311.1 glycosyltransferase family 2 protein [Citrobacter portucalensis]MEB0354313.1 glycosyltransferase family 2 protein [Citrobacter portucalensis]MEB0400215.1 glycosyltransferase family 2 protein [Citrobacter portucalensis]UDR03440.1 glycosyltransferase [Citrobacter freundii]